MARKRRRSPSDHRREATRLVYRINKNAARRQDAWTEGGQPDTTDRPTRKLDKLYGELNEARSKSEVRPT